MKSPFWELVCLTFTPVKQLRDNTELVTDPQLLAEKFNSFFIETVNDLLSKNSSHNIKQIPQYDVKTSPRSMFVSPVTENEVENIINKLKGKSSAGFDEIPEFLVKRCSNYIKNPLLIYLIYHLALEFSQI